MEARKLSRRGGTQIDDLPSCLLIDILSRLPLKPLITSRFVCKSWSLLFSDPLFVRLHSARSPTLILRRIPECVWNLERVMPAGEVAGEYFKFEVRVNLPVAVFLRANSCRGLLCLENPRFVCVCNPILGEYITIPTPVVNVFFGYGLQYFLGFSPRSNRFKVLLINSLKQTHSEAEIYTIGDGTRRWKSIGIAPSCCALQFPDDSVNNFLNGSIHWADRQTRQIVYFDFDSEQFGSLPFPASRNGSFLRFSQVRLSVFEGCLCIYGFDDGLLMEEWVMKEYGVEESWTLVFSTHNDPERLELFYLSYQPGDLLGSLDLRISMATVTYRPSFISLRDVARSENLTVISRTRTIDRESLGLISNYILQLYEDAAGE